MRPDLPLILAIAVGAVAIVLLTHAPDTPEAAPPRPQAAGVAGGPDVLQDFYGELGPAITECFVADLPSDDAEIPPGRAAALDEISSRVEGLRGLDFAGPLDAAFLDAARFRERLTAQLERELKPDQLAAEGELLAALGAVPAGTGFEDLISDSLGSQVAGFYDPRTSELVVPRTDQLPVGEEVVLAHELEHAMADQALGLRNPGGQRIADRALAYTALVEGDASVVMNRYSLAYAFEDVIAPTVTGADDFDAFPDYLQRNLAFPYLEGMRLVCYEYLRAGTRGIDHLYESPPASSAEVMFPSRYGGPPPRRVAMPSRPAPRWELIVRRELGAAELEWLFQAPGGEVEAGLPDPRALVAGWAGGEVGLWRDGEERALAISLVELPGSNRLCAALAAWYRASWPEATAKAGTDGAELELTDDGRSAVLACPGRETRLGISPDLEAARALAGV